MHENNFWAFMQRKKEAESTNDVISEKPTAEGQISEHSSEDSNFDEDDLSDLSDDSGKMEKKVSKNSNESGKKSLP